MKKGILLIAAGHPNYGKMAAALAATLRCSEPQLLIHLAYAGNALKHLSIAERELFSSTALIPEKYFQHKGERAYIKTKMHMYDLSPFDETIFLDADMLWLKQSPENLFALMAETDISFSNFSTAKYSQWADVEEIKQAYPAAEGGKYYSMHSELLYFKKSAVAKKFFSAAKKVYDSIKVKSAVFAGAIPDELPFSIAALTLGIHPHAEPYRPVYWMNTEGKHKHIYEITKEYIAFSMGGSNNPIFAVEQYNILTSAAYRKLGLQHPYKWKNKKSFLQERQIF